MSNPIKTTIPPESRANRAKRMLKPVLDARTRQAITNENASPFAPVEVEIEYSGRIYFALYRAQDVNDGLHQRLQVDEQRQLFRSGLSKITVEETDEKGNVTAKQRPLEQIVELLTESELDTFIEIQYGEGNRAERVECFGGHVEAWNATDEEGQILDFSLQAFRDNRGFYDAALTAFQQAFLKSRSKVTAETENPVPLSMIGDTPSTPPATDTPISESGVSPDGPPNSD